MAQTLNTGGFDSPIVYKDKSLRNTVVLVTSQPTNLTGWRITNLNSSTAYVKFFDASTLNDITLGTTEPCKEFSIPALGEIFISHLRGVSQYYFSKGMAIVAVNSLATNSTTSPIISIDVEIYYAK